MVVTSRIRFGSKLRRKNYITVAGGNRRASTLCSNIQIGYWKLARTYIRTKICQISYWVASSILSQRNSAAQVRAVKRFILVAQGCEFLGNYNGLFMIMMAFQIHAISRLMDTWEVRNHTCFEHC